MAPGGHTTVMSACRLARSQVARSRGERRTVSAMLRTRATRDTSAAQPGAASLRDLIPAHGDDPAAALSAGAVRGAACRPPQPATATLATMTDSTSALLHATGCAGFTMFRFAATNSLDYREPLNSDSEHASL